MLTCLQHYWCFWRMENRDRDSSELDACTNKKRQFWKFHVQIVLSGCLLYDLILSFLKYGKRRRRRRHSRMDACTNAFYSEMGVLSLCIFLAAQVSVYHRDGISPKKVVWNVSPREVIFWATNSEVHACVADFTILPGLWLLKFNVQCHNRNKLFENYDGVATHEFHIEGRTNERPLIKEIFILLDWHAFSSPSTWCNGKKFPVMTRT